VSGIDSEHSAMLCESMAEVNQLIRDLGVGTYHALIPEFSAEQIAAMTDDEVEACCDLVAGAITYVRRRIARH
jgi:hypothetical protein